MHGKARPSGLGTCWRAGPRGLPLVGVWLDLASKAWHTKLYRWSVRYKGYFKVWAPFQGGTTVYVSEPVAVHTLLQLEEKQAIKDQGHYLGLGHVSCMHACMRIHGRAWQPAGAFRMRVRRSRFVLCANKSEPCHLCTFKWCWLEEGGRATHPCARALTSIDRGMYASEGFRLHPRNWR